MFEEQKNKLLLLFVKRAKEQFRLHGHSLITTTVDDIRWGELGIRHNQPKDHELMKRAVEIAKTELVREFHL